MINYLILKINDSFSNELKEAVIKKIFPQLNDIDTNYLYEKLIELINYISLSFGWIIDNSTNNGIDNVVKENYYNQLRANNYKDAKSLLLLLLPYIDDPNIGNDDSKCSDLKKLTDIYILNQDGVEDTQEYINNNPPKYKYTNIQYNRCIRGYTNTDDPQAKHRNIGFDDIGMNFVLLKETIARCANRLFVNWYNIIPYTLDKYEQSLLYKNSKELFDMGQYPYFNHLNINLNSNILLQNLNDRVYHLYIGHIYDNLVNNHYFNIKRWRWILYDILDITTSIPTPIPIFATLINDLELDYNNKTTINKTLVEKWKNNLITKNNPASKIIIKAFIDYYKEAKYEEIDKMEKSNIDEYVAILQDIEVDNIIQFISDTIEGIKGTWFWYYFVNSTYDKFLTQIEIRDKCEKDGYTPKMIYNYAKLIAVEFNNPSNGVGNNAQIRNARIRGEYWSLLNNNDKVTVKSMFNLAHNLQYNWFIITRYIGLVYNNQLSDQDIQNKNNQIYIKIRSKILDIVFQTMIINGSLTKFNFDKELRDNETNDPVFKDTLAKKHKHDDYKRAFGFINSEPYDKTLVTINTTQTVPYIEYMTTEDYKTSKIATLNWVSQIQFFHKYFNNRVIFVTGGTGVGKSSQVPKLTLYALKTFDYKIHGQIICTQPTIPATTSVAIRMSNSLGVQINKTVDKEEKKKTNEIDEIDEINETDRTDNFNIQYNYDDKSGGKKTHVLNKDSPQSSKRGLFLKFCTDGILYKTIQNKPLMLTRYKDKNNEKIEKHSIKNEYDILIIDESHTHNPNMDLILTIARYSLFYNRTLKLLIMSATMDDDESYYRRFYRDINDNLMYPINVGLQMNMLDRIVVDRRYHVGSELRYKINEIYHPDPKYTYLDAIKDILLNDDTKDILLFQTGAKEIIDTVKEINKNTPANTIALPLFSTMHIKDKITDLTNIRSKLINPKDYDFTSPTAKIEFGISPYKRYIIVATNMVEASITIDSLGYVIDNGFYNSVKYDYKLKDSIADNRTEISEQSRLQRKGRVGRVADGTVHYLYSKDARKNNRHDFSIETSDISFTLYDLLAQPDSQHIINYDQLIKTLQNPPSISYNQQKKEQEIYNPISNYNGFEDFIKKYYLSSYIDDNQVIRYYPYLYFGNTNYYDYNYDSTTYVLNQPIGIKDITITGIKSNDILDNDGTFYIIHPEETKFVRNLQGDIIEPVSDNYLQVEKKKLISDKIFQILISLRDYLFVFGDKDNLIKTNLGSLISRLNTLFSDKDRDDNKSYGYLLSYLYSRKYGCDQDLLKVITLYIYTQEPQKFLSNLNAPIVYTNSKNPYGSTQYYLSILNNLEEYIKAGSWIPSEAYTKYKNKLNKFIKELDENKELLEECDSYLVVDKTASSDYNINLCFMHGFIRNVAVNLGGTYLKLTNPTIDNIVNVHQDSVAEYQNWDYIVYLTLTTQPNSSSTIDLIHGIRECDILSLNHIFNNEYISDRLKVPQTSNSNYISNMSILKSRIRKYMKPQNLDMLKSIDKRLEFQNQLEKLKKSLDICKPFFYITA